MLYGSKAFVVHPYNHTHPLSIDNSMNDAANTTISDKKHAQYKNVASCSYCGCWEDDKDVVLSVCGRCKETKYCSKACQLQHWKEGHQSYCKPRDERRPFVSTSTSNKSPVTSNSAEIRAEKLAEEFSNCSICFEAINYVSKTSEQACSHVFHTSCVQEVLSHCAVKPEEVSNACPLCRQGTLTDGPGKLHELATKRYCQLRMQVEIGHGSWKTLKSSQRREMKEVIRMWTKVATEQRSAHAQFMMGCLHDRDVEFDKRVLRADMKEGAIWLKKAAEQGHAIALYKLGFMYSGGIGVDKDQQESSKWFLKSAAQGYDRAQFSVGVIFLHGEGVKEDKKEALQWFLKAAEQGHSKAQFNAAALYFLHGVDGHASWHPDRTSDLIEAARWYREAAGQGCAQSQYSLASMYLNGLGGLEVDETKALKLTALAAKNGNALAQKFLDSHVKDAHLSEPPHEPASSTT